MYYIASPKLRNVIMLLVVSITLSLLTETLSRVRVSSDHHTSNLNNLISLNSKYEIIWLELLIECQRRHENR